MPLEFQRFPELSDVILVKPKVYTDSRGWFSETYKRSEFASGGIPHPFVQCNHAHSLRRGTVRGLHFQIRPAEQGKLVRCLAGEVDDIALDIRKGSRTYGKWVAAILKPSPPHMLWIPPGFAHGIQSLTDGTDLVYKITHEYSPAHERTVRWNDPALDIRWPIREGILNPRDEAAPGLAEADNNFS